MKPHKLETSKSGVQVKSRAKKMKKGAQVYITPINKYFKSCTESKLPQKSRKLSLHLSPTTQTQSPFSPVSRSSLKKRNSLTPVKLFQFDFSTKIPSPSPVKCRLDLHLPTPPSTPHSSHTPTPPSPHPSHSCPSTPDLPVSHQSFPSSIEPPPFSPISIPSPQTKAWLKKMSSAESPLPSPKPNAKKRSHPIFNRSISTPSRRDEVIVISSDSDDSKDVLRGRVVSARRVTTDSAIVINSSSDSGLEPPEPKKVCTNYVGSTSSKSPSKSSRPPNKLPKAMFTLKSSPKSSKASPVSKPPSSLYIPSTVLKFPPQSANSSPVMKSPKTAQSVKSLPKLNSPNPSKSVHTNFVLSPSTATLPVLKSPTPAESPKMLKSPKPTCNMTSPRRPSDSKPVSRNVGSLEDSQLTSAVKSNAGSGCRKSEKIAEVRALLWRRGCPHLTNMAPRSAKVGLLNSAQSSIVENYLDFSCRFLSAKLDTLAQYLALVTSPSTMPPGESLAALFMLLSDPERIACCVHPDVRDACVRSLRGVLLVHPPGSHAVVDRQYRQLVVSLEQRGESLWELMQALLRGPSYCSHLLSFLVDVLLLDYWAVLQKFSDQKSLFLSVFWSSGNQSHMTTLVRQLFGELVDLLQDFTPSRDNDRRLDSLFILVYLCDSVCADVSTTLLTTCWSLPSSKILLLLGRLSSYSLYTYLTDSLPHIKQTLIKAEETLNSSLTHRSVTHTADKNASSTSLPLAAPLTENVSSQTVHDSVSMEDSDSTIVDVEKLSSDSAQSDRDSSDAEQVVTWTTVTYGEDKFPCVQVSKSPPKRKSQSPKDKGSKTQPTSPTTKSQSPPSQTKPDLPPPVRVTKLPPSGKPVCLPSQLASIVKPPKVPKSRTVLSKTAPKTSESAIAKTSTKHLNGLQNTAASLAKSTKILHKPPLVSSSKNHPKNGPVHSKGGVRSTLNGCVRQPKSSTLNRNGLGGLTLSSHSSHCLKSTQTLPQRRQPVIAKPLPTSSHGCTNSVSRFKPNHRPPWKLGTSSSSLTRPSLEDVRRSKPTSSAKTSSHAKKESGEGGNGVAESRKSLVATGAVHRECENCVSGACVNPTNAVHALNV